MDDALYNSAFLKACRGEQTDFTPIWLNRQAGRYMPEYHQVKGKTKSLDFFKTPELAARATCDAQRILGVDAAIMFADLLPILEPMGLELDYIPGDTGAWHSLMEKITTTVIDYMNYQIDSGVQAVQLFDSWVGALSPVDYREYVMPHSKRLMDEICGRVPVIHFGTGNPALAPLMAEAGGDVLALDWRTPLMETWNATGVKSVQGNMDPIVLCADVDSVKRKAKEVLDEVGGRAGHIFNLGHGIIPETPVENVKALVDFVHEYSARNA
jgi:uroporphyrinogen-III decarboxylase